MAIITISRGTFSGGKELAECIAKKLGYRCVAREVLVEAAARYGAPLERLTHAMNDKPGILEGMTLERAHYMALVRAALAKAARDEQLVYHGHAGHLLLKDVPHIIRVKVLASMEYRIKAAMERKKLNREQAIEHIKKVDSDRVKWTRFLYHVDWNDLALFDVMVNIDKIGISNACDIVSLIAQRAEFQPTPESHKIIENTILAADVRAKIAAEGNIPDDEIEIEANDGIITITGAARSLEDADKIREVARKHPGVKEIVSRLRTPIQSRVRW